MPAPAEAQARIPASARLVRPLTIGETAWVAAIPAGLVSLLLIAVLGPAIGNTLLTPYEPHFWQAFEVEVRPEPIEQGRYVASLAAPLVLTAFTILEVWRRPQLRPWTIEALVVGVQAALVAFVVVCLLNQEEAFGPLYPPSDLTPILVQFFTPRTLLVAAAGTIALALAVRSPRVRAATSRWSRATRGRSIAAGAAAVAAIVVWLLHAVNTEATIGATYGDVLFHVQFPLDETFAVLDGRSPLVDFAAQYGSLWPYVFAGGMSLLGETVGVWVTLALLTTGLGMLAVYAVLRRVTASPLYGLMLFLPVLATSFYQLGGTLENRYTYGNYFGTFPMRYAGPAVLAWLVARHLGGAWPRRCWPLFLLAGVVALNNADAGVAALGATVAAVLWALARPTRAGLGRFALEAAGALLAAFALVSLLTLVRAGSLPDLGLLLRYARLFGSAGFAMYPMPTIGLHLAIYLTFVAAIGVATVRALGRARNRTLTGMLAWTGVFGLSVGAYFASRSTPENMIATFFAWSFATALLLIPALRELASSSWRRPPIASAACLFAFLAMACSLAQTPTPWSQLDRLQQTTAPVLAMPAEQAFVDASTERGEPVAILVLLGHRIAAELDLENVSPYSNSLSMATSEQVTETLDALHAAGGHKLFVTPSYIPDDMKAMLGDEGFVPTAREARGAIELWRDDTG